MSPLEKEVLIKRYLSNPCIKIKRFCESCHISVSAFKSWLKKYNQEGINGLITKGKGAEVVRALPEGVDETDENLKRENMRLLIELERLKKGYTVEAGPDGKNVYIRLKEKNTKS